MAQVTLLVREYDEAIQFYTAIGFTVMTDTLLSAPSDPNVKRWVVIAPPQGASSARLLLAKAIDEDQLKAVGNQAGGRVLLFLYAKDFDATYGKMKQAGVTFLENVRKEVYGSVVQWKDLYGNKWDLLEDRT